MFFYLKISCKDKRVLKKFLHFFTKVESLPLFFKSFPKREKRKFVTVLKSPHVNKTAQEQFEYRFYSKHFLIRSFKPLTFFLLLKKLKDLSFPGLNIEVQGLFEKNKIYKHALQIINPDNLELSKLKPGDQDKISKPNSKNSRLNFLLSKQYIQLFDLYGEICLRKNFYF
jgi:hypothetical protein